MNYVIEYYNMQRTHYFVINILCMCMLLLNMGQCSYHFKNMNRFCRTMAIEIGITNSNKYEKCRR